MKVTEFKLIFAVRPWLSWSLLLALLCFFVCEIWISTLLFGFSLSPSPMVLMLMGALDYTQVIVHKDYFRLLSAPLLHAGLAHFVLNGIALFFVCPFLEFWLGRGWCFALFGIGALSGSVASLLINPQGTLSIGASGAIMGLFAALYVLGFRIDDKEHRRAVQVDMLRMLIPSLLPLFAASWFHIDYGAHLGGAIGGAVTGLLLLKTWPVERKAAPFPKIGNCLGLVFLAAFIASLIVEFPWSVLRG